MKRGGPLVRRAPLAARSSLVRRAPLRQVSPKRRAANRVRREVAISVFGSNPGCARPGCKSPADDVHEPLTRARGGSITDATNMIPLCRRCHGEVQLGPAWAYGLGLMRHSWAT